jgi:germination protein M
MRALMHSVVAMLLLLSTVACGDSSTSNGPTVPATNGPTTTAVLVTSPAPSTSGAAPATTTAAPTSTTTSATTSAPATPTDIKVYLVREGRLVIAHRQVAGPAVLQGALTALLNGPTAAERTGGLDSAVPAATQLLDVALADGQATVDLSGSYGTGGGSLSTQARVAQVVFTATQFPNVDRVLFRMDGAPVEFLGGEGLGLTAPQTRAMTDRSVTGAVLIDAPAPGTVVHSPFTVTGEGDVYEAQFPIEVWSGGRQVGGVAPVSAGAWGSWAPFEVTVNVDASPGPIELVAYDEGGCGTDPECPPIVKTLVPLTLG